jgi:hypothetical protein
MLPRAGSKATRTFNQMRTDVGFAERHGEGFTTKSTSARSFNKSLFGLFGDSENLADLAQEYFPPPSTIPPPPSRHSTRSSLFHFTRRGNARILGRDR